MKKFIYNLTFFHHNSSVCLTICFFLEFIQSNSQVLSYIQKLKQIGTCQPNKQTVITAVVYLEKAQLGMATLTKESYGGVGEHIYLGWPIKDKCFGRKGVAANMSIFNPKNPLTEPQTPYTFIISELISHSRIFNLPLP